MIYIYTENFIFIGKAKTIVKKLLGRGARGPQAVLNSLLRGLKELGTEYRLDEPIKAPVAVAYVLSGAKTLRWAIQQKKAGRIKKLVAGPNIVVFPGDDGAILTDSAIDVVVVPSEWVKEKYELLAPHLRSKIKIWPAGVKIPDLPREEKIWDFLIYNKAGRSPLLKDIERHLADQHFKVNIFEYGKFSQSDYFQALGRSRYEIYLSPSESQGLAMFEAWARGVPTLVWDRGFYEYRGFKLARRGIACPYLNQQTGNSFKDFTDFKEALPKFVDASYAPRAYIEQNFTNKICASRYLELAA